MGKYVLPLNCNSSEARPIICLSFACVQRDSTLKVTIPSQKRKFLPAGLNGSSKQETIELQATDAATLLDHR